MPPHMGYGDVARTGAQCSAKPRVRYTGERRTWAGARRPCRSEFGEINEDSGLMRTSGMALAIEAASTPSGRVPPRSASTGRREGDVILLRDSGEAQ